MGTYQMHGGFWKSECSEVAHDALHEPLVPEPLDVRAQRVGGQHTYSCFLTTGFATHEGPRLPSSFLYLDGNRKVTQMHGPFDAISRELPMIDDSEPSEP